MKKIIIPLFLVYLFYPAAYSQQEVTLTIEKGIPQIPIAVPPFIARGSSPEIKAAAKTLHEVFTADMTYSLIYVPLKPSYYNYIRPLNPEKPDKIFFKDWDSIGAKQLLIGVVSAGEGNSILFEAKLYDVKAERFIRGKRYQADPSLMRLTAHKLADVLMINLGEPPFFTTKIVFCSNRDGNWELYMMDYDGYNQIRLTFNKIEDYMPAWSADGQKIAYTAFRNEKASLYLLHIYDQKRELIYDQGTCWGPCFSPDGKKLAFSTTRDESNTEIYLADGNTQRPRRLTVHRAVDTNPSWSPTSRELVFTSDRGGNPQIYVMDAEGSNIRRRSFGGTHHDNPSWSPRGDRIAYVSRVEAVFDIYVLDLRTDQIIKLTEGYSRNETPKWSPDGRHIIFSSNRTGTTQLYSMDLNGGHVRRLTSKGDNKLPDWARK